MSRVLIADDHAVVRAGFKQFLEADPSINAVGEAASGNETLDQLRESDWDLVLLDIHMPDRSGLDILRHIQTGHPGVRVLVMSGLPEQQYAVNVLRAGASGYLSKDSAPEELMKAVRTVLSGRRYVSAALAEILVADLDGDPDKPLHARLSTREFQIFCKLAAGRGVSDIANELSPEREDRQHLSQPYPREDELHGKCRHNLLCAAKRAHPISQGAWRAPTEIPAIRRVRRPAAGRTLSSLARKYHHGGDLNGSVVESLTRRRLESFDRTTDRSDPADIRRGADRHGRFRGGGAGRGQETKPSTSSFWICI